MAVKTRQVSGKQKADKHLSKKSKNERDAAYHAIQDLIMSMHIKPGEVVTETALSDKVGIGRTPVREALKVLEQEGLIVTKNRRKRVYILTVKEIEEIFDLKISIEGYLVKKAAEQGDKASFSKLSKCTKEMRKLASITPRNENEEQQKLDKWLEVDKELHTIIFNIANNKRAEQVIRNLNTQWHRLRVGIYTMEGRMEKAVEEHEKFVGAIVSGNGDEAEMQMRTHLDNLKRELVKILKLFHYPID